MDQAPARGRSWLTAGGGVVVGAAAAVATLLAMGWSAEGTGGPGELTLPDTADGLRTQAVVAAELGGGPGAEGRDEAIAETAELLGASRGGAAAEAQTYADDDLDLRVTVWAVSDESPALWTPQEGELVAEFLGFASPTEWVERDAGAEGEEPVECLMHVINPVLRDSGGEVEALVSRCQLITDGVTLTLEGSNLESIDRPAAILRDVAANMGRG